MAKRIGLNVYGLSVVSGDRYIELHDVFESKTLIDLLHDFALKNKDILSKDSKKESIFYFDMIEKEEVYAEDGKKEFTILYGRVKTGE